MTKLVSALLGCLLVLGAIPAVADPAHDQAKQHFLRGVELYSAGDFAGALPEFEGSYQLNPVPEVLFNLAFTQRGLHRYADAVLSLQKFLHETQDRNAAPILKRREDAERTIAEIETLMGGAILKLTPPTSTVKIDGHDVSSEGSPIYLDPGMHELDVTADGYVAVHRQLAAMAGTILSTTVALEHEASVPVATTTRVAGTIPDGAILAATPSTPVRKPIWKRTGFWVGISVGVVVIGVVAGTLGGVLAHRADNTCGTNCANFSHD